MFGQRASHQADLFRIDYALLPVFVLSLPTTRKRWLDEGGGGLRPNRHTGHP